MKILHILHLLALYNVKIILTLFGGLYVLAKKRLNIKVSSIHFTVDLKFDFNDFSHSPVFSPAPWYSFQEHGRLFTKEDVYIFKFVSYIYVA